MTNYDAANYPVGKVERAVIEARDEYGEPHAGRVYTNVQAGAGPSPEVAARYGFHSFHLVQGAVDPRSPHTTDRCVQAYNVGSGCATRYALPCSGSD